MGLFLWDSEPSKIFVGDTPISKVFVWDTQVRPTFKVFTISRTEQSNMSSGWTYSDDAAWLTAGSTAFDEFFWYSAVRLNTSWVETAEVKQNTPWQLDFSQLWTLTSGDNVMIKFPRLWIKMSKSWSVVTLSITDNPDAEADGFQYYAHSRWTLSSPIKKDALYLWAFKAYNDSWTLKSWSDKAPTWNQTQSTFLTQARANDGNTGSAGYDIIWFYQREFVNALYMMKYWNPDSQSVVWQWYTNSNTKVNTWWTVSQIAATYWTSSTTTQIKLFWLEDWWGNVFEWVGGMCADSNKKLWTALSWFVWEVKTTSPYSDTDITMSPATSTELSAIAWTNKWMFALVGGVSNSSYNTYYCDLVQAYATLTAAWGRYSDLKAAGAFNLDVHWSSASKQSYVGGRIMYL